MCYGKGWYDIDGGSKSRDAIHHKCSGADRGDTDRILRGLMFVLESY